MDDIMTSEITVEDELRGKYLTFRVSDGEYGIEISYINEIIGVLDITPVPNTRNYVKGIINLRGGVVPVIDMRLRFGHAEQGYNDRTSIIVLSKDDVSIGLIVDEVQEVASIDDESVQAPPKNQTASMDSHFVKAIGAVRGTIKQLLDIDIIFEVSEENDIAS